MKSHHVSVVLALLFLCLRIATASDQHSSQKTAPPAPRMSKQTRLDLIRAFEAELVYIRSPFPMGRKGLTLKDGEISPSGPELQRLVEMWGPAVKPGDAARITSIAIKDDRIHFEINGGPVKKRKWYERISVGGMGGEAPIAPTDPNANPRGSSVDLVFDHYIPELTPPQLKQLLRPVFDFDAKTALEAFLQTVPPKVQEAIKNHQVLVGMNREMVVYAKGKPPKKIREKEGETEYEDWIYGEPPQDVDFVRLVGDEVTRVETMKVSGEKIVRTQKEVEVTPQPSVAKTTEEAPRPDNAPTLRRPGEEPASTPTSSPKSRPPYPPNMLDRSSHLGSVLGQSDSESSKSELIWVGSVSI